MSIIVGAAMGGRLASIDALSLVFQAGWVVQLVLLVLLTLSVVSWTIIVYKWRELRRAGQDSEAFLEIYQEGSLESAYTPGARAGSQPARGHLRHRLRRALADAEVRRQGRPRREAPAGAGAPHRLGRLAGGPAPRARPQLPRDHRQRGALHRALRHGDRHHQRLPRHRAGRARPAWRWWRRASPRR